MSDTETPENPYLTPKDMDQWAQQEMKDVTKAFELRLRELTNLAAEYSAGNTTPKQADEMHSRYYHRWGEALPGHSASDGVTDEQLLAAIDKVAESINGPFIAPADAHKKYVERIKGGGSPKAHGFP